MFYNVLKEKIKKQLRPEYTAKVNTVSFGALKDYHLFFDHTGIWQSQMLNGTYDKFIFDYISKLDLRDKTVFDIGAHIGYHSLYFSRLTGGKGKIYAIEPNIFNVERIHINLNENPQIKNIYIKDVALSDKISEETFIFSDNIENGTSSGGFLDSSDPLWQKEIYLNKTGFKKIIVRTITLDSLTEENKDSVVGLLKIDVEGAENLVLEGGKKFIRTFRPIILMEIHSIFNMFEVLQTLSELSYNTTLLKKEADGRCFIACVYNQ